MQKLASTISRKSTAFAVLAPSIIQLSVVRWKDCKSVQHGQNNPGLKQITNPFTKTSQTLSRHVWSIPWDTMQTHANAVSSGPYVVVDNGICSAQSDLRSETYTYVSLESTSESQKHTYHVWTCMGKGH